VLIFIYQFLKYGVRIVGFIIFCITVWGVIYAVKKEMHKGQNSYKSINTYADNNVSASMQINKVELNETIFDKLDEYFYNQGLYICDSFNCSISDLINEIKLPNLNESILRTYIQKTKAKNLKDETEFLLETKITDEKNNLLESYDIDISILDEYINTVSDRMPVTVKHLSRTYNLDYKNSCDREDFKFDIEDELEGINEYYALQLEDANNILSLGIKNFSNYDFEQDKIIFNNIKYYSEKPFTLCMQSIQDYVQNDNFDYIEKFYTRVLKKSVYPKYIKKDFNLEYNKESETLIVNFILPKLEDVPSIEKIKYVFSQNVFKENLIKDKARINLHENILYQLLFRTKYEIYKSDIKNHIKAVVFNGWTPSFDAYGNETLICVLSAKTQKNVFKDIDFSNGTLKAYFKKFKGIGNIGLENLIPIKPVLNFNKEDKRFVESYSVVEELDKSFNLATMHWQNFENLIRELFEKEFGQVGGDVKVTQSSRDGGVDAIIFDPDPIRGGKIIVQAKRYTNVVGVSAVRDLYGTMRNEGAIKGILATTSNFGTDSYDFAKDKPLVLIDGQELLKLLEKQGYEAYIDLEEAKKILYS